MIGWQSSYTSLYQPAADRVFLLCCHKPKKRRYWEWEGKMVSLPHFRMIAVELEKFHKPEWPRHWKEDAPVVSPSPFCHLESRLWLHLSHLSCFYAASRLNVFWSHLLFLFASHPRNKPEQFYTTLTVTVVYWYARFLLWFLEEAHYFHFGKGKK